MKSRSWLWEEMTAPQFSRARKASRGVCILPVSVMEKHGEHLPLGTDELVVRALAKRAVAMEPAVIFPPFYWGQIHEARHVPGTIALPCELSLTLLDHVCEEIARNGFHKIILLNGHGGNRYLLPHFITSRLEKPRPYTAYLIRLDDYMSGVTEDLAKRKVLKSREFGHACEVETSLSLALNPELVDLRAAGKPGKALKRLKHLPPLLTAMFWYADYPRHYAGDARPSTAETGNQIANAYVRRIANVVRAVKRDTVTPRLEREFFARTTH